MPGPISGHYNRFLRMKFRVSPWQRIYVTNSPLRMKSAILTQNWALKDYIRVIFHGEFKKLGFRRSSQLFFWQLGFVKFSCRSDVLFSQRKDVIMFNGSEGSNRFFIRLRVRSDMVNRQNQYEIAFEPENRPWISKTTIFACFRKHDIR